MAMLGLRCRGRRPQRPVSGNGEGWICTNHVGEQRRANAVRPYRRLWGYQGLSDNLQIVTSEEWDVGFLQSRNCAAPLHGL